MSLEQGFNQHPCWVKKKKKVGLFRLQADGAFDHWKSFRLASVVSAYR